ncbi:hypothetical protein CVV68_14190 [Arthrobacter livingstonensis]|uniref:Uncharacterized protein n=1 Tax=Arthrobacter livingstonensis TaxID=670078 RepID=A0A2V5L5I0_9MICC|nr:hypothetical protein CVV68_14190 [Arthrobacter livingstonensis]
MAQQPRATCSIAAKTSATGKDAPVAAAREPQPLDFAYTAPIHRDGAFVTYLVVDGSAVAIRALCAHD